MGLPGAGKRKIVIGRYLETHYLFYRGSGRDNPPDKSFPATRHPKLFHENVALRTL